MKIIGIVGRAYYNKDNQKIIQVNEMIRNILSSYDDVVSILLLPTNIGSYGDVGNDQLGIIDRKKLDFVLDKCDGFIVPGGTSWYHFDEYVIEYAKRMEKPLLAICVGFQAMCSMFAKKRDKFDMTKRMLDDSHYNHNHWIYVYDGTILKSIVQDDKILINSLHHSYIDFDMRELVVSSRSEDGIVESVELLEHPFFVGIQWHPEYLMDVTSIKIFDTFLGKVIK